MREKESIALTREDCFVKHLERREFEECGCNKRWFYRDFGNENFSNKCPESVILIRKFI